MSEENAPLIFISNYFLYLMAFANIPQTYRPLAMNLGQLLSVARLYNPEHPVFKEKARQVFAEITKFMRNKQSLILSESEGVFLIINGEKIEAKDSLIKHFVESFHSLQLGSLDLEPGLSVEELVLLIRLLSQGEHPMGETQIKEYLRQSGAMHIIPRFATYKLVEENEKIVKDGGVLSVEDIPLDFISRFSEDFIKGEVPQNLKKNEKAYLILAHNPKFLSGLVFDLSKEADKTEELAKILWLIGDYLISEISTVREEEINRKILNELKERLLYLLQERPDKARWKDEIEKMFVTISAALELKGLILLYKKHKKELEAVVNKLVDILETLPFESQIYKKTKEDLEKIGPPSLDSFLFH